MWIRSQNKEFLKLCNEFRICERVKNKKIVGYSVDCFDVELGVYSTKEKALKAMDLLQSRRWKNDNKGIDLKATFFRKS